MKWIQFGCMVLLFCTAAMAAPSPDYFFRDYQFSDMVISPSGRYLATLVSAEGATNIMIIDLVGNTKQMITKFVAPANVQNLRWKSDDRLVFVSRNVNQAKNHVHDLAAVKRDGSDYHFLSQYLSTEPSQNFWGIVDWLPEDPDSVLWASAPIGNPYYAVSVLGISSNTAIRARGHGFATAGGRNCWYVTDHHGDPRICFTHEDDLSNQLNYRANAGAKWETLAVFRPGEGLVRPLAFAPDDNGIYALSNLDRATFALFEFDPLSKRLGKLVFEAPGTDIVNGVFGTDGRTLIGVVYGDDYTEVHFLDPHLAAIQASMTAAFPGRHAIISSQSSDGGRAIVFVQSESNPGSYYLYDENKRAVEKLADLAPWIDGQAITTQKSVQIKTPDGTLLQGYLNTPTGSSTLNLPLVLMPSAAPGGRFGAGWAPVVQFLVSRGYAVLRVNGPVARNGIGLGAAQASGAQWTLADVQSAIVASTDWAVTERIADPRRIAILGTDFNGYVALMAMAARPEFFRCGISYGGELDLQHLFDRYASSNGLKRERAAAEISYWESVVGSRKNVEYLRAQSPLYNIARFQAPIFLAYSTEDLIVPFADAKQMRDELTRAHQNVVLFSKADEPHLFERTENKVELFTQIASFLESCNPTDSAAH